LNSWALFTDVSLNPERRLGVGSCLLVPASLLNSAPDAIEQAAVTARLQFRRFAETSSTRLEVQTVLWGVEMYREHCDRCGTGRLQVYTDSQCVVGLPGRRGGLEANGFVAARSGRLLANAPLYRALYAVHDELGFDLIKVAGHSRAGDHGSVQRIFSYVDRGARRALSLWLNEPEDVASPA
jgi:ribonuclease HI